MDPPPSRTLQSALTKDGRVVAQMPNGQWKAPTALVFERERDEDHSSDESSYEEESSFQVRIEERRRWELTQFFDADYASEWKCVVQKDNQTVEVQDLQGQPWTVVRDLQFLERPPKVFRNGIDVDPNQSFKGEWSPALTSTKWLLMMMQLTFV